MIKHEHTEPAKINFSKLGERLIKINSNKTYLRFLHDFWLPIIKEDSIKTQTLIMATGGSKVAAYYLQNILESKEIITEVIEPRDYFYKKNIDSFGRLIVISDSGKTNGVQEALHTFKKEKYLFASDYALSDEDYILNQSNSPIFININWANELYSDREKSFISLSSTLGPMLIFLELACCKEETLSQIKINDINNKVKLLIQEANKKIENIDYNFSNASLIQVMSGYDTKVSATVLESNMTECGACPTIVHDKGSYCHGRSNLLFQNPDSPLIYLTHGYTELDLTILEAIQKEYPNIFLFDTVSIKENNFWKEFALSLQMFYLSRKIADDKQIDLTQPEYNPRLIKKFYKYKGEM